MPQFNSMEEYQNWLNSIPHGATRQMIDQRVTPLAGVGFQGQQMGNLSEQLLDPNSELYSKYQDYLKKTMPQIGVNTLLAPLLAGGASYGGAQSIAQNRFENLNAKRNEAINTATQGFAMQNIGTGANLLGQQANLGLNVAQLREQQRQYDEQNSFFGQLGGLLGSGLSLLNPFGGMGSGGGMRPSSSAGGATGTGMSGYNDWWNQPYPMRG